ncbi:iron-containing redox enzyme family protein [Pseudomonas sp. BGI-2]|uniref:iron-containing redox enzyme family protein n=1 Tax=Pseudomonas sp. BGI-2 TaxID=2528211 RepID=UPI00103314A3|nr:iron-containing redox enzyme family protein [Pseudomonas sp. BGI-2]TBN50267.1 iron-containing redox enzyme family protein [Pseudomonas sp. BGI-2]
MSVFESVEFTAKRVAGVTGVYKNKLLDNLQKRLARHVAGDEAAIESDEQALLALLESELNLAFVEQSTKSLAAVHFLANELLRRRYLLLDDGLEMSPLMFKVQQRIMQAQLQSDLASLRNEKLPSTEEEFKEWFNKKCANYKHSPHPLFEYIEHDASLAEYRNFIETEAAVHVSFDDVIALAQIGVRGSPKLEFFDNFQDELGSSDPEKFHLTMFGRLVSALEINTVRQSDIAWQAVACGNYMLYLAHFRSLYHYCAGYLGFLEALTPKRFSSIAKGGARLGLSEHVLAYHYDHSELDVKHAEGWLDNIILSEIKEKGADVARLFALGVLLRELVSKRYWDAILNTFSAAK